MRPEKYKATAAGSLGAFTRGEDCQPPDRPVHLLGNLPAASFVSFAMAKRRAMQNAKEYAVAGGDTENWKKSGKMRKC